MGTSRTLRKARQKGSTADKARDWIRIDPESNVTVVINHSEMGQGITTALAMIVAEELEADWSKVRYEMAPVAEVYKHPHYGLQWTVSSRSVESSWLRLRQAGAVLREMLQRAAARILNVPTDACRANQGKIHHPASGRSLDYGALLQVAAQLPMPEVPPLKDPAEYTIIGRSLSRLDGPEKIDGKALFGTDIRLPNMFNAAVVHCPVFEGQPLKSNAKDLMRLPGVRDIFPISTAMAIVADTFYQACSAADRLQVQWQTPKADPLDAEQIRLRWYKRDEISGKVVYLKGEGLPEKEEASWSLQACYDLPYQAHAPMEPMNCTADVRKDSCHIWVPTQNQQSARDIAARLTGLPLHRVHIHTTYLGCGFGRRALVDYVAEAVEISMRMQAPVKLIWTREEDFKRDHFRPATHNLLKAHLDDRGHPTAWLHRIVGVDAFGHALPQVIPSMLSPKVPGLVKNAVATLAATLGPRLLPGKKAAIGAGPLPYNLPQVQVEFTNDDPGYPVCWWRSVAPSSNCFAVECFLDEIAVLAGRDPIELRLELLVDNPRLRAVLKRVEEKSNWGRASTPGRFHGVACQDFQGTMMAMVAEISVDNQHRTRVHRVICALDCGVVINPAIVRAQVEGGIAFGLTATLKGEITFEKGAPQQRNFNDYPLLRFDEMPEVQTHIVASDRPPTGIGEVAVPIIGPAVVNALHAATGRRIRKLPVRPVDLR